VYPGR
jgi:hypothetical protein